MVSFRKFKKQPHDNVVPSTSKLLLAPFAVDTGSQATCKSANLTDRGITSNVGKCIAIIYIYIFHSKKCLLSHHIPMRFPSFYQDSTTHIHTSLFKSPIFRDLAPAPSAAPAAVGHGSGASAQHGGRPAAQRRARPRRSRCWWRGSWAPWWPWRWFFGPCNAEKVGQDDEDIHRHTYIHTYIHIHRHRHRHTYIPTYLPTYIHIDINIIYIYVYIYVYIYIYTSYEIVGWWVG